MQVIYSLAILSFTYVKTCIFCNMKLLTLLTLLEKLIPV